MRLIQTRSSGIKHALCSHAGFSLVELMTASVVLLIMMGSILSVMRVSTALNNSTQQGLDLQQNVRSALDVISSELTNAGSGIPYVSAISGSPVITVPAGALIGPLGAPVASGTLYFITPGDGAGNTVTRDGEGNVMTPIQTDRLTFLGGMGQPQFISQTAPGPTANWGATVYLEDNSTFSQGQVVLVSNGFQVSLGQITQVLTAGGLQFSNGADPLGLNAPASMATPNPNYNSAQQVVGGPPPLVYPLSSITYFIDSATDPRHPMLKRIANSAGGAAAGSAVADNIENFQVSYYVDTDRDATTANDLVATNPANPSLIRGAMVTITGRSQIKMGDSNYADRHSRLTMSQTVLFRNNVRR